MKKRFVHSVLVFIDWLLIYLIIAVAMEAGSLFTSNIHRPFSQADVLLLFVALVMSWLLLFSLFLEKLTDKLFPNIGHKSAQS